MTHGGGLQIAGKGLLMVQWHAPSGAQQIGQVIQAPIEPGAGSTQIMPGSLFGIGLATPAVFVTAPEHVARHRMSRAGSDGEPFQGECCIALDTLPIEQNLPQQCLSVHNPLPCSDQQRLRRLAWFGSEHGLQLLVVEYLVAAQAPVCTHTSTQRRSRLW